MSQSGWRYVLAAVGLLVALSAYAQEPTRQPEVGQSPEPSRERQETNGGTGSKDFSFPVRIIEDKEEAERAQQKIEQVDKHDAEDLKAQQQAAIAAQRGADAAENQTIAAYVQIGFAFIGTTALIITLLLSYKSTNAAVVAAKAALDAVNTERAWMCMGGCNNTWADKMTIGEGEPFRGYSFAIVWKNCGRSPALVKEVYADYKIVQGSDPVPIFAPPPPERKLSAVTGPDLAANSASLPLPWDVMSKTESGLVSVYIYGIIKYSTIFEDNKIYKSEVCFSVRVKGETVVEGRKFPAIEIDMVGDQNSAT